MTTNSQDNGMDDMSDYLQTFIDETEEQLEDLVETMLALEKDATNHDDLNEAFRLIHSIKGSAGIMGFESITVLTHHLESRFERFRSGSELLDEHTTNLVLRCIDFLGQCNNRLRNGEELGVATELLEEMKQLEQQSDVPETRSTQTRQPSTTVSISDSNEHAPETNAPRDAGTNSTPTADAHTETQGTLQLTIRFQEGLQLVDLKARLIVARLSSLGMVKSTRPDLDSSTEFENLRKFSIFIVSDADENRLRESADVAGVESVAISSSDSEAENEGDDRVRVDNKSSESTTEGIGDENETPLTQPPKNVDPAPQAEIPATVPEPKPDPLAVETGLPVPNAPSSLTPEKAAAKVAPTMRVDTDRLDNLMNLAGELVVNRARFEQLSGQIDPALRKSTMRNRVRDFRDSLRQMIESVENGHEPGDDWSTHVQHLRAGLALMGEQSEVWDNSRKYFIQMEEAIDQLTRVSHNLQRGVLDTRMVQVGPLFNRFNRVVRDLSKVRGKSVNLLLRGDHTELDKRMIDELGDPLVHLVRNAIDHGLESKQERLDQGKSEIGNISLEASHTGNNVYIVIRDDGRGIDPEKIKSRLVRNQILSETDAARLSREQALEYIWSPGFSTASEVTDVSGRGVGMDVVKTKIGNLNGTIDVDSTLGQGTCFTICLPLTLAIINCLLVRLEDVIFSIPIDDVSEILSFRSDEIISVLGKQTFEIREEYLPLFDTKDIFRWGNTKLQQVPEPQQISGMAAQQTMDGQSSRDATQLIEVVIMQSAGKKIGLRVDEFLGSQDMVVKSLSDNFINIRGLSGASILGDGGVTLMLDVRCLIETAIS